MRSANVYYYAGARLFWQKRLLERGMNEQLQDFFDKASVSEQVFYRELNLTKAALYEGIADVVEAQISTALHSVGPYAVVDALAASSYCDWQLLQARTLKVESKFQQYYQHIGNDEKRAQILAKVNMILIDNGLRWSYYSAQPSGVFRRLGTRATLYQKLFSHYPVSLTPNNGYKGKVIHPRMVMLLNQWMD